MAKRIRRKISSLQRQITEHEDKIRKEKAKPIPDWKLIKYWQKEIQGFKKQLSRLGE